MSIPEQNWHEPQLGLVHTKMHGNIVPKQALLDFFEKKKWYTVERFLCGLGEVSYTVACDNRMV